MKYWEKRLSDISDSIYNEGTERANKRYREIFDIAAEQIDHDVTALYERMQRDGEITPLSIYKQKRYQNLKKSIKSMANNLGVKLEKETQKVLEDVVTEAYEQTGKSLNIKFDKIKKEFVDSVVNSRWSGEMFSKRIWDNVSTLAQQVEKNVVQSVIIGRNKDECVKDVMKRFGTSFNNADRLVRTEVMYSVNSAQGSIYQQAGYTEYRILVAHDERLCDICGKMVDKKFPFSKKEVGVNYPPFHPRCRCTIVPVLQDDRKSKKSANSSLDDTKVNHSEVIDNVDYSKAKDILNEYMEELFDLPYEVEYTITKEGKVYRTKGEKGQVIPDIEISELEGAYTMHNHPNTQTYYSFSADDVSSFLSEKHAYMKAFDSTYQYEIIQTKETIFDSRENVRHEFDELRDNDVVELKWKGLIDPDLDEYHEIMKRLADKYKFIYRRWNSHA